MTPEQWTTAKAIFDASLDYDTAERPAVIQRLAGGDELLESEVLSLLRAHQQKRTVLDLPDIRSDLTHPQRVGGYRILRPVGNGGAGIVYEAERADTEFRQRVALKLLHPTAATQAAIQRFQRERQLLASLEHPNLTRFIDGGVTSDGFPFLVMEFVDGVPLMAFCDQKGLSTRQRLELFLSVCETVDYAHSRLVVHRDIKPANVFVDRSGRARLLDFGIAKLMDSIPGSDLTATGFSTFTPSYASPEQVRGEMPAVSMDVYALGVLLFELLSGKHPLGDPAPGNDWVHRVLYTEPGRLSDCAAREYRHELKGDLESICARAMEKDALRRYRSVSALADDIQAHLEGRPIAARKGQTLYIIRGFIRRNAVPLAAGTLVLVALATALILVRNESRRAERSYHAARRSLNSILSEAMRRDVPAASRRAMLTMAAEYIELLDEESARDADAAHERITIAFSLAGLYGEAFASNLGDGQQAETLARHAIALTEQAASRFPRDKRFRTEAASGWMLLGDVLVGNRKWQEALGAYERSRELLTRVGIASGNELDLALLVSVIDSMRGDIMLELGKAAESLAIQESVLTVRHELARRSDQIQVKFAIASAELSKGNALLALARYQEAVHAYREAAESFHLLSPGYEDPHYARQSWVVAAVRLGDALAACGEARLARETWQSATEEASRLYRDDTHSALALGNLNAVHRRLGKPPIDTPTPSIPDPRLVIAGLP